MRLKSVKSNTGDKMNEVFMNSISGFSTMIQEQIERLYPECIINYTDLSSWNEMYKIANEYNLLGKYESRIDKEKFFNNLLGIIYGQIDSLVDGKKIEYIIVLLRLLEYNRYLARGFVSWSRKKEDDSFQNILSNIKDKFLKSAITQMNRCNQEDEMDIFHQYEYALALGQSGIESVIERVYFLYMKKKISATNELNRMEDESLKRLFDYCYILQILMHYKSAYVFGECKENEFVIDDLEKLIFLNRIYEEDQYKDYYEYITSKKEFSEYNIFNDIEINKEIKKCYGLNLNEMKYILQSCNRENLTETFIADTQGIINFICINTKFQEKEVSCFVNNLIFKLGQNEFFIDEPDRCRRASRKFLLDIDSVYVFPYGLLSGAVINIIIDTMSGDSIDKNLNEKLRQIYQKKNKEFEKKVFTMLTNHLKDAIVKSNVQNIARSCAGYIIPNEIDIVLLYNKRIYIIECKDITLKTTVKKMSNTANKFMKEYNKNLLKKINEIEIIENKQLLLEYMGDVEMDYLYSEVIGIFVISEYFGLMNKNTKYPIIVWEQLIEYICKL